MKNEFLIKKINKEYIEDIARVVACTKVNDTEDKIFFETSIEYADMLCADLSDAFVLGILLYAMQNNLNIRCETPITEEFYENITLKLIPALKIMNPSLSKISIIADKAAPRMKSSGIATGLSAGVDFFYTILKNLKTDNGESKLTHLTLFNATNFGKEYSKSLMKFKKKIAEMDVLKREFDIPLVWVNTNLMSYIKFHHGKIHSITNIACALVLQNGIGKYYYSSGYTYRKFSFDFNESSHYDIFLESALSTYSFRVVMYDVLVSRQMKLEYISSRQIIQKNLVVCNVPEFNPDDDKRINCSQCSKCIRTMVGLDLCGKINLFNHTFDISFYNQNKAKFWGRLRYNKFRQKDEFASELIEVAKQRKYRIPKLSFVWAIHTGVSNQIRKLKKNERIQNV